MMVPATRFDADPMDYSGLEYAYEDEPMSGIFADYAKAEEELFSIRPGVERMPKADALCLEGTSEGLEVRDTTNIGSGTCASLNNPGEC